MRFYRAKNCLTLLLAVLPVFCRGFYPSGCLGADGQYYATGDLMPSSNPCEVDCRCKDFDQVVCSIMDCARPPCENPTHIEGQCCPVCAGCNKDGVVYNTGDLMPSSNPCEVNCRCEGFDQVVCSIMDCARPPCENPIQIEGQCCPVCAGCNKDGVVYNTGDLMPSSNPCEVDCRCKDFDQVECSIMDCARPPCENPIHIEGQCCPVCAGCNKDGVVYNTGKIVNNDPCRPCTCQKSGQVTCENIQCSKLTCMYQVVPKGECCPVCQCRQGNKYYLSGEIMQNVTCTQLICQSNGSIKAESVKCEKLQCVDPVIPIGKCCPECKNGRTCERKKVIIKYGGEMMIGNEICRCGGDPWFPNAFCAVKNVSEKLLKNFGQYLANYKP